MAVQWTDAEIDSGVSLIFTRLGYHEVKTKQLEAKRGFIKDKDVFVSLPTGSCKSTCYGCLPLVFGCLPLVFDYLRKSDLKTKSIVVVVSPLKALMLDQVRSFSANGVDSVCVTDGEAVTYEL